MATRTQSTVVAVFRSRSDAEAAMQDLKSSGFAESDIFLSSGDTTTGTIDRQDVTRTETVRHHEGGVKGWFKSLFGEDEENEGPYYENAVTSGHILLSVETTDENMDRAADILNRHSPIDVQRDAGETDVTTGSTRTTAGAGSGTTSESSSIPVVKEELRVGKRAVLRGGVRVYSRMVEEPVEETVRLREERVRVERMPANRSTTEADLRAGQEQVIEVKEFAEEPVVSKQARVVEEIHIGKDASERSETVRDTVRHTEVKIENLGGTESQSSGLSENMADDDFRRHYTQTYGSHGQNFESYGPAYQYGYEMAGEQRYKGRTFDEAESDLRAEYSRRYPNSTWEQIKDSVRYGWDKITGKV